MIRSSATFAGLLFVACSATTFAQQYPLRFRIAALSAQQDRVKSFSQTAISPDGSQIAWSVDGGSHDRASRIYLAPLQRPRDARQLNAAPMEQGCSEHDPVWAGNGVALAFLSDCASPGQDQLFIKTLGSPDSTPRQLTHLNGYLSHPRCSPSGHALAFLFVEHASRRPSPMAAENNAVGVIDDLQNRDVQALAVTDLHSAITRKVTPENLYVFEYDWSPDGSQFVITAAAPPGDDNWYIARLYTSSVSASPADRPREIYKPQWQIAVPRWSPDGRSVAFIEGLMSDEGGTGGELFVLPANGGKPRNLTPGRISTPSWFTWLTDVRILFTEFVGGSTAINTIDTASGQSKLLWRGDETIRAGSEVTSLSVSSAAAPGETTAFIRMSWSQLPEVWAGPIGNWKQITSVNREALLPLPRFENVTWKNAEFNLQGWLLYPQQYDPQKHYPMLVAVHGGPAWIATPEWRAADFDTTLFTNFGYFVFFPNVRGSYGQGEMFTRANRRDWGFGDMQDLLAGVDTVTRTLPIDKARIGLLGWSYGGSTAMMAITRTNRFRAVVAGAGAADWLSYYGQNSIDKWMLPYFGASVYDDPAAYLRCSAITHIKNAKTPALVLVGERDGEAPPPQSLEFWHALKELNVPTQLIIYAGEGHSFAKREDRIDVTVRTLEWFNHYMSENHSGS